jgi:hypothetical protein
MRNSWRRKTGAISSVCGIARDGCQECGKKLYGDSKYCNLTYQYAGTRYVCMKCGKVKM